MSTGIRTSVKGAVERSARGVADVSVGLLRRQVRAVRLFETQSLAMLELQRATLTTLTSRGFPLRRLSCLVHYCLVCCLPPASCRLEQDTPIQAHPPHRRRRCMRIAFGCVQDFRTINDGRF